MNIDRTNSGFALPAALFGLVILGVLMVGGFFMARQETRVGFADENGVLAFYWAEKAALDAMHEFDAQEWTNMTVWDSLEVNYTFDDGSADVIVTKVTPRMYFVNSTSTLTRGGAMMAGASRNVGMIARLLTTDLEAPAALTTRGGVNFKGSPPRVIGTDQQPSGWATQCTGTTSENKPGIITDTPGAITGSGGTAPSWVDGSPAVLEDPDLVDATFDEYSGDNWRDLTDLATHVLSPGTYNAIEPKFNADGSCNRSDRQNWGDPMNPGSECGDFFPIIHVTGSLKVGGDGVGQGILLVDGDITIVGTFDFFGVVVTKGIYDSKGTMNVNGAVLADGGVGSINGTPDLFFSSCAVERAILNNDALTRARPLAERSWVDITSISQD